VGNGEPFLGLKRPTPEVGHLLPYGVKVKNEWSSPYMPSRLEYGKMYPF